MNTILNRPALARDQVVSAILEATTASECREAADLRRLWLEEHPRDFEIIELGAQLAMVSGEYGAASEGACGPDLLGSGDEFQGDLLVVDAQGNEVKNALPRATIFDL